MFQDKEVEKRVRCQLGIPNNAEILEADLDKITEIMISNWNPRGEDIHTDLSELVKLKKLKILDLKGFELSENVSSVIQSFPELVTLCFYNCQAEAPVSIRIEKLKKLVLDHCQTMNFSEIYLPETLLIVDGGIVDASKFEQHQRLKNLEIKNSEIVHAASLGKISSLRRLNIDGSTLDDESVLAKLKNKRIAVSNEFEYHPLK